MAKLPKGFMTTQDSSTQRTRYAIQVNKGDLDRKKKIEERAKELGASFDFNKILEDTFVDLLNAAESAISELDKNNSDDNAVEFDSDDSGNSNMNTPQLNQ